MSAIHGSSISGMKTGYIWLKHGPEIGSANILIYISIISIINIWFYYIYFCSSLSERWLPDLNP